MKLFHYMVMMMIIINMMSSSWYDFDSQTPYKSSLSSRSSMMMIMVTNPFFYNAFLNGSNNCIKDMKQTNNNIIQSWEKIIFTRRKIIIISKVYFSCVYVVFRSSEKSWYKQQFFHFKLEICFFWKWKQETFRKFSQPFNNENKKKLWQK